MAQALDYQVTVCDPREEYADEWNLPVRRSCAVTPTTWSADESRSNLAVVAVTHDPKARRCGAHRGAQSLRLYVGALGSKLNNDKRRARLADFDLSAAEISRLHGPVGLKIGSRTPAEIAISILAEITAVRLGVKLDSIGVTPASSGCLLARPIRSPVAANFRCMRSADDI